MTFAPCHPSAWASADEVARHFSIILPDDLCLLLAGAGAGYSARKELLVFGADGSPRSLVDWNKAVGQLEIHRPPVEGGPLWLAENCVGMQYGLRAEGGKWIYLAFDPNTFESYRLADHAAQFLSILFGDAGLVALDGAVYPLIDGLGPLLPSEHYAPCVSLMVGGSMAVSNWCIAPARAHLAACHEEFKALQSGA